MKISQLPKEIQELALQRQKECTTLDFDKDTDDLDDAFYFKATPEGEDYWIGVFNERIITMPPKSDLDTLIEILEKIELKQYEYIDILRKEVVSIQDIRNIFSEYGVKIEPKF